LQESIGVTKKQITKSKTNSRIDTICNYLDSHEYIQNNDVQILLDVSSATATRILRDMTKSGIITKTKIGSHWGYKRA